MQVTTLGGRMGEAHVGPLPEGMKHCRVCAEPINKAAQKCIHCQTEQSVWRRRLGFSSTVLALLIALISVLSSAVPAFKEILTPKDSHLSFTYLGATDDYIGILISNSGNRPGSVRFATLQMLEPNGSPIKGRGPDGSLTDLAVSLKIAGLASNATEIIGPGANTQANFYKASEGIFSFFLKRDAPSNYFTRILLVLHRTQV
jgi:hypothetical protein